MGKYDGPERRDVDSYTQALSNVDGRLREIEIVVGNGLSHMPNRLVWLIGIVIVSFSTILGAMGIWIHRTGIMQGDINTIQHDLDSLDDKIEFQQDRFEEHVKVDNERDRELFSLVYNMNKNDTLGEGEE